MSRRAFIAVVGVIAVAAAALSGGLFWWARNEEGKAPSLTMELTPPSRGTVCTGTVTEQCASEAAKRRGGPVAWIAGKGQIVVARDQAIVELDRGDVMVTLWTNPTGRPSGEPAGAVNGKAHFVEREDGDDDGEVVSESLQWTRNGVVYHLAVFPKSLADTVEPDWLTDVEALVRYT